MVMAEEGLGERSRKVAEGRRGERLGAVVAPEERGGGEWLTVAEGAGYEVSDIGLPVEGGGGECREESGLAEEEWGDKLWYGGEAIGKVWVRRTCGKWDGVCVGDTTLNERREEEG